MPSPTILGLRTRARNARLTLAVAGCCTLLASLPASAQDQGDQSLPKIPTPLDLQDGDTLVFLGDSITHQCLYTQHVENFFHSRYPERLIRFHNAGVSGDKAADALARFDDDVAAFNPKYVTLLLGMNDGQYEDYHPDTFSTYARGMVELLDRIEAIGATAIVMSPTMFDHHQLSLQRTNPDYRFGNRDFADHYNALLAYFGGWLRERANERSLPFVDQWSPLNDLTFQQRRQQPDYTLVPDAIHPGAAGQFVMAHSLLSTLTPDRRGADNIAIMRNARGEWTARSSGTVSDLEVTADGSRVAFTYTAISLPWVVPEETFSDGYGKPKWDSEPPATEGYAMTKAGHQLSAERLRIPGLAAGRYRLTIDGEVVAENVSDLQLAARIELQANPSTPQYQQALGVAHLNRQRNDDAVRPMRDLWSQIKGLRRKLVSTNPEAFTAEYGKRKTQIEDLQERIADFDEQIHLAAQPKARHYVIERIKR